MKVFPEPIPKLEIPLLERDVVIKLKNSTRVTTRCVIIARIRRDVLRTNLFHTGENVSGDVSGTYCKDTSMSLHNVPGTCSCLRVPLHLLLNKLTLVFHALSSY